MRGHHHRADQSPEAARAGTELPDDRAPSGVADRARDVAGNATGGGHAPAVSRTLPAASALSGFGGVMVVRAGYETAAAVDWLGLSPPLSPRARVVGLPIAQGLPIGGVTTGPARE